MNRRSFFKFLPIAPVALVAEGARACIADGAPTPGTTMITFTGSKPLKPVNSSPNMLGSFNLAEQDLNKQVSMTVGEDGNLWLKRKDGEWKRIVTE